MNLFYSRYKCHSGALLLHKHSGVVYRVRGSISLWDMTAVLVPNDITNEITEDGSFVDGVRTATSAKLERDYLILDEGVDPLNVLATMTWKI